jgi:hypothetical protein
MKKVWRVLFSGSMSNVNANMMTWSMQPIEGVKPGLTRKLFGTGEVGMGAAIIRSSR